MDGTTKLLDMRLMARIIHEVMPDLPNSVKKIIVFYIDIDDQAEIEKFIVEQNDTEIEIELRDLKPVLAEVVVEDYAEFSVTKDTGNLFGGYKIEITKFISDRVQDKIDAYNDKSAAQAYKKGKQHTPLQISETGLEIIEFISIDSIAADGPWHSNSEVKIAPKTNYSIINGEKTKNFWDGILRCDSLPLRIKIRNICGDETVWTV